MYWYPTPAPKSKQLRAWVAEVWEQSREEGDWNPHFFRHFNDWEMELVGGFFCTVQNKNLCPTVKDRLMQKKIHKKKKG